MDKQLNVQINLAAGANQGARILEGGARAADELAKKLNYVRELRERIGNLEALQPRQGTAGSARLERLRPLLAAGESSVAQIRVGQELTGRQRQQHEAELRRQAYETLTGGLPPEEARARSALVRQTGGIAAGQVLSATQRGAHPLGNQLAGVSSLFGAFSSLPGPIGAVASGLSLITSVVGHVASAFRTVHDSTESLRAAQEEFTNHLRSGRQTGLASADELRAHLTPMEQSQFVAAQQAGNSQGAAGVLQQARVRLQGQADQAQAAPGRVALAQGVLERAEQLVRSTEYRLMPGGPSRSDLRTRLLREAGFGEAEIGQISNEYLTPAQIRANAQTIGGGQAVQGLAGVQAIDNIMRTGVLPNLRPGGLNLQDLPNLFQSRQGDVLDVHSQVQQEAVRDRRQEQQFQAQMRLWQDILEAIEENRFEPQVVVGGN